MSMKRPWLVLLLCGSSLCQVWPEADEQGESSRPAKHQQKQSHHRSNLRRKPRTHKEAAGADYSDTSVHGDKAHYFNHKEKIVSGKPAVHVEPPIKTFTSYHLLTHAGARESAAHVDEKPIPGVDYGDVKYPDLMADIEDLYNELKYGKKDKAAMKKHAKKIDETQEAHENVTETVEEHVDEMQEESDQIEYIDVSDCINSFRHKRILKHLKEMHPAQLEGSDPGVTDFDIETMCQMVAKNGTISKRDFVSGFMRMVQKRVNNEPVDCESFAYYVMSGGAFDELAAENRHLAMDNIDLAGEIERAKLGADAPPLPKPKLQDLMLWQLGKREDPAEEAHQQMDEVHEALQDGDADDALKNLKELKQDMGKAQDHLKEKGTAHGWKIKRHSVEAGLKGNESLENETLHMSTNDTLHRLGTSVEEQLANFDKCDKDGDGELWEKEFLACELKKVEEGVVADLAASGKGTKSPGHHCAWRLTTLTSGHLYQQTEELNQKLRWMNFKLHEDLHEAEGEEDYIMRRTRKHTKEIPAGPAAVPPPIAGAPAAVEAASPASFYAKPAREEPETAGYGEPAHKEQPETAD